MRDETNDSERVSYRKCEYQAVRSLVKRETQEVDTKQVTPFVRARRRVLRKPKGTVRLTTRLYCIQSVCQCYLHMHGLNRVSSSECLRG